MIDPRGDGYQDPQTSSAGSGAAMGSLVKHAEQSSADTDQQEAMIGSTSRLEATQVEVSVIQLLGRASMACDPRTAR